MNKAGDIKIVDDTWFTSDHHFGHKKIIEYAQRPFSSIEEHDEELIRRWNSVVDKEHVVYHLGDFTLGGSRVAQPIFERLNGKIYVLGNRGHHDRNWLKRHYSESVRYVSASDRSVEILEPLVTLEPNPLSINQDGTQGFYGPPIVLCHFPMSVWDRKHYGSWHLYGHTHDRLNTVWTEEFAVNVGVDAWDFTPASLSGILNLMRGAGWSDAWLKEKNECAVCGSLRPIAFPAFAAGEFACLSCGSLYREANRDSS